MSGDGLRLDKWLWFARLYKSRTLAARLCEGGRVRVNGVVVDKAHHLVREGDVLTFVWNDHVRVLQVIALGRRRGAAREAQGLYSEIDAGGGDGDGAASRLLPG